MPAVSSSGSPLQRRSPGSKNMLNNHEDGSKQSNQEGYSSMRNGVTTLTSSKFANTLPKQTRDTSNSPNIYPMDTLLAKLSEQQAAIREQNDNMKKAGEETVHGRGFENQGPIGFPQAPGMPGRSASAHTGDIPVSNEELLRLKLELARAQNKITRLDQELANSRSTSAEGLLMTSMANAANAETELSSNGTVPQGVTNSMAPNAIGFPPATATGKLLFSRDNIWGPTEENQLPGMGNPGNAPAGTIGRSNGFWRNDTKTQGFQGGFPSASTISVAESVPSHPASVWPTIRPGMPSFGDSGSQQAFGDAPTGLEDSQPDRLTPDPDILIRPATRRRGNRLGANQSFGNLKGPSNGQAQFDSSANFSVGSSGPMLNGNGMSMFPQYQQAPIGTPLSPHAAEFATGSAPPWKNEAPVAENQTFVPTTEPLNYRRLLDRNVNCNWKYIVDKIVGSNDQQASIFLQQKLKVGTADQKYDIVEAIVSQAYPLMINRFGNFLVQRCFEHGTSEQIIKIAEAIRGNTLSLSMDPFGCHVVQKAFDSVPEDYKAIMVHELLRRIPETVIHRYACHVWQKLFELRWNDSPPQIMKYVNEALRGMWHEVALGETGSLVVQNIFENCLEEDKRPCIEEVLGNIDVVAHGQFGNWCIQHICEHGAQGDRGRAIDHVICYAAEYSMDQFASKVVEKCLKIGGGEFLGRYLDRVCEGRVDRPRIPLIDIASDQYGNYLIQYILTHASPQHREVVAAHIRKHMVSLRGSKFGSRVGMLCTNPAVATRPGPGVGPSVRLPPRYGSRHRASGTPALFNPE